MIFRNLDENGDWTFGRGKNDFLIGQNAIGLNIKTRCYSWLNDCFFAMNEGIDWAERLGSKNQKDLLDADLRRIILASENVTGLVSFDSYLIGRKYTANFSVNTVYSKSYTDTITIGL